MRPFVLRRVIPVVAIVLALSSQGAAQRSRENKLEGIIHHYTATLDVNGPWHISGVWSVWVKGQSGRADFSAELSMLRSDNATRQPHTHHVTLVDGDVIQTGTGFAISGTAEVTGNGSTSFLSTVEIQITGGSAVPYSNVSVRFTGGPAMNHFGAEALGGVVTR
jgi:hypothetical protein